MSTETAQPPLTEIGYRWTILLLGACWGAVPALSFGLNLFGGLSPAQWMLVIGTLMTLTLGIIYELDNRRIKQYYEGVPLAWSYALVAPIAVVFWEISNSVLAQVPGVALIGIFAGPPASALLYLWQRGRLAESTERRHQDTN